MFEEKNSSYQAEKVSVPGLTLQDILEERGMTQAELAERIGRTVKMVNEIIKGKAPITPETAIQLERALGASAEFWNKREANYRSWLAKQNERESLFKQKGWLEQFPIKEMKKRGIIQAELNAVSEVMIDVLNFFGVATPEQWELGWTKRRLAFRRAANLKAGLGAISVWLREGELQGEKMQCSPYDKESLISSIDKIRLLTLERDAAIFIPKLQHICAHFGVAVVITKPFQGVALYGASCWLTPDKALIQLSTRGKSIDKLWFTFFHELGHIIHHSKKDLFIELDKTNGSKPKEESEADKYASEVLIPSRRLNVWLSRTKVIDQASLVDFSKSLMIAPGLLVARLQHIKRIKYDQFNELKTSYEWD